MEVFIETIRALAASANGPNAVNNDTEASSEVVISSCATEAASATAVNVASAIAPPETLETAEMDVDVAVEKDTAYAIAHALNAMASAPKPTGTGRGRPIGSKDKVIRQVSNSHAKCAATYRARGLA